MVGSGVQPCVATSSANDAATRNLASTASRLGCLNRVMPDPYAEPIALIREIQERIREIRFRYCEPKSNSNPRYLALSNAVAGLNKAICDMEVEQS